ncbi:hypothetical protein QX226_22555 [Vibrio vulnificus]|uniref:hypothetical protein n=1 Tax=Vibrio vulnificus TaxID=672 RepID=UPI00287B3B19|nr:hypothetical protein [Vibrio vulnificus]MDS1774093.1 hypothetical protein [Vibrio vulnificus]MDS1855276.1 hypothetical protein [Vibrio vulnificus]
MNEIIFLASIIECYTENDVLIIGVGDDKFDPENYIVVSRFDDGDVDDSIGIQTHLSEIEVPNAIMKVCLRKNKVVFFIKESKIQKVQVSKIEIDFTDESKVDISSLEKYIHDIFVHSSTVVDIDLK